MGGHEAFTGFSTLFSKSDGGDVDVSALIARLGLPPSPDSWARLVSDPTLLPDLTDFLDPYLQNITHVFGFGLTPNLMQVFDQRDIAFLDVELATIRFSKHINFRARTNSLPFQDVLKQLHYPSSRHRQEALFAVGTRARGVQPSSLRRGIFTGQAQIDLALVENGQLRHAWDDDILKSIADLTEDLDEFYVLPHPGQRQLIGHLVPMLQKIPKVILSSAQTYTLLTHPDTKRAVSLSSGTLKEAAFFGIDTAALITPDRDNAAFLPKSIGEWTEVNDQLFDCDTLLAFAENRALSEKRPQSVVETGLIASALGENQHQLLTAAHFRETPTLSSGLRYDVTSGATFNGLLQFGWSHPEDWGVWSDGQVAALSFRCSVEAESKLTINGIMFGREAGSYRFAPIVTCRVTASGQDCDAQFIHDRNGWKLVATLPKDLVNATVFVHFFIVGACSPRLLSVNADPRKIAIGLKTIGISQTTAETSGTHQHQDSGYYLKAHREIQGYQENNWMMPFAGQLLDRNFQSIVECASGNGEFAETMAPHVQTYWALDWAPSPLVPYSVPHLRYQRWDAYQDKVPSADLACSADFLEHIRENALDRVLVNILGAAHCQFHVIACYDDYHSHLTIEEPAWWLDRLKAVSKSMGQENQNWRLIDWPLRDPQRPVAIVTNFL